MSDRIFWDRIFAADVSPWDTVDALVKAKTREGLHLDFKTTNSRDGVPTADDQKNLAKCLSAFANTGGGVVVFGIKEKGDEAERITPIPEVSRFASRLGDLARDRSDPPVPGVEVTPILDPSDTRRGVIAVRIPQSVAGPHRATNAGEATSERYYQRSDSHCTVIPHRLLAALFAMPGIKFPELRWWRAQLGELLEGDGVKWELQVMGYIVPPFDQRVYIPIDMCRASISWIKTRHKLKVDFLEPTAGTINAEGGLDMAKVSTRDPMVETDTAIADGEQLILSGPSHVVLQASVETPARLLEPTVPVRVKVALRPAGTGFPLIFDELLAPAKRRRSDLLSYREWVAPVEDDDAAE